MDDLKLLGLQRAEFEASKRLETISLRLQFAIVIVSILVIAMPQEWVSYVGGILNFILAIFWKVFSIKGRRSHYIAERARRAVLLSEGLGVDVTGKLYSDIHMQFTVSESDGRKHEEPKYYEAHGPPGYARLANMLQESAFWSKHLFDKCANKYWWMFGIGMIISLVVLSLTPTVTQGFPSLMITEIFCVLLTWLVTGDLFTTALRFTTAARAVDDVENRLNRALSEKNRNNDIIMGTSKYSHEKRH